MGNSFPEIVAKNVSMLTNSDRIKWQKISDYTRKNNNAALEDFILNQDKTFYNSIIRYGFRKHYYYGKSFCIKDSFCAEFEGGLIYLFSVYEHPEIQQVYILAVQGTIDSDISRLNNEMIAQDALSSLYSLAKEQVAKDKNVNNDYIAKLLNITE